MFTETGVLSRVAEVPVGRCSACPTRLSDLKRALFTGPTANPRSQGLVRKGRDSGAVGHSPALTEL